MYLHLFIGYKVLYEEESLYSSVLAFKEPSRILLSLSRGGADATVIREFDLESKAFINENENPFNLLEFKNRIAWKSKNVLLVGKK